MTTVPALVDAADLSGFPGAPFADSVLTSAMEAVRAAAGWHIAPSITETMLLDGHGGHVITLPTLHLTAVSEVRDTTTTTPRTITGWRKNRAGVMTLPTCWPCGLETIEVDATHGYDTCPADLLPLIVDLCLMAGSGTANVRQEASGSESVTYLGMVATAQGDARLAPYRIIPL